MTEIVVKIGTWFLDAYPNLLLLEKKKFKKRFKKILILMEKKTYHEMPLSVTIFLI